MTVTFPARPSLQSLIVHHACVVGKDFRALSVRIMNDGPPSYGDDLTGMIIDLGWSLEGLDEIDDETVEVQRTGSADKLIRASCRTKAGIALEAAGAAVRDIWLSQLRYSYFEAHELNITENKATLDFITQIGPKHFYVTGQIIVSPA